ncbi:hypothetical protein B0J11DRAFT_587412 [Dendryphion nanum]|uniref:Tr-type G domain-containing protein n=1 Tax=Dendryphion nanum TaxID=256645 RepID=A0A9P9EIT5_9PLEO|nr:hypothetical protein B0J11DRAFT_587412 [Dendryphion nanum]
MSSIFSFDDNPPRVSSPWATPPPGARVKPSIPQDSLSAPSKANQEPSSDIDTSATDYSTITRLEAEPQEGPTEYKLHLLVRRRRSFIRTTTCRHVSGSLRLPDESKATLSSRSTSESDLLSDDAMPLSYATQSAQNRLDQLTTQLLWRLQQSCPIIISSNTPQAPPITLDEARLSTPAVPRRLLPGLEESKGALYEIGVADDGTFVGLAEDEMEESLNNLRVMAASLGCIVSVQRMVQVGDCEWYDNTGLYLNVQKTIRTGKLWVVEALVRPDQIPERTIPFDTTQQIRMSLTGATASGKSSLLGSLTTATLDNGRGKSRLSLLKHRHEIASGMTSSITQELIGYHDIIDQEGTRMTTQVINYGSGDVSTWVEIHAKSESGRLVFLSDSAGHPRFHRTTVRGLVGWDPHWTLCCIPADNTTDSSGKIGALPTSQDILGPVATDIDLSLAHLQLCLNLELPLVLLITKYDLATKAGLKQTLSKVLSAIKAVGRTPYIVRNPSNVVSEADLNTVSAANFLEVEQVVQQLTTSPLAIVPILFTSVVNGKGINTLHAFLRNLPLPAEPESAPGGSSALFYIEDIYSNTPTGSKNLSTSHHPSEPSTILGGHLRYGTLNIGDTLLLGPYPIDLSPDDSDSGSGRGSTPPNRSLSHFPIPTSRSFPGALQKHQTQRQELRAESSYNSSSTERHDASEWRRVRITSLRNLRLPVRILQAGQVGTVGVAALDQPIARPAIVRVRKGMVATHVRVRANRVVEVEFFGGNAGLARGLGVGTAVVVYVASVRASAKVVSISAPKNQVVVESERGEDVDDAFGFDFGEGEEGGGEGGDGESVGTVVTFQFIASREFVEDGAKVLVLPGGGPGLYGGRNERGEKGLAGLESFVGRVVGKY